MPVLLVLIRYENLPQTNEWKIASKHMFCISSEGGGEVGTVIGKLCSGELCSYFGVPMILKKSLGILFERMHVGWLFAYRRKLPVKDTTKNKDSMKN